MTTEVISRESHDALIKEFANLYQQGIQAWTRAGEIIVKLVDADPHAFEWIIAEYPDFNPTILSRFEKIGRKLVHPKLFLSSAPGTKKLQSLPYSVQERLIEEPVPLIVEVEGGVDVLLVKAKDMSRDQADQCFASDHVRTEAEQRAWIIDRRSTAARNVTPECPWKKAGKDTIEFTKGAKLNRKQIMAILMQLE
jgi:hypothetical protein